MDPRDIRPRYDPSFLPHPPPPNFYPHPQFHPHIHPPPPPPPRHHRDHHSHPLPPYFPYLRVHPHEPWDNVDVNLREIRAFHDRPVQLDWDRDVERRVYGRVGKDEILEEDFRVRVRKDEMLEEDFRTRVREDRVLDEGFRDRVRLRIRNDGTLEEDFSPRVSDSMGISNSEIGFHGNLYMENKINKDRFEENHYMDSKGKRKLVDMGNEDYSFRENRENNYIGNKGKRRNLNVGSSKHNEWNSPKKTSALGRIQSGISVWNRIAEKPSSPSPPPCDPTQLGLVEDSQPEIDSLDLSYKSNALVAKVLVPSSLDMQPTSEGKSPRVVVPKDRLKTKKVVNDREQVVIPIVSRPVTSRLGEGVQGDVSKPLTEGSKKAIGSYNKAATDGAKKGVGPSGKPFMSKKGIGSTVKPASDGLKNAVGSSNKPAVGSSSQSSNKKAVKVTTVKKIPVKRAVKVVKKNIRADHNLEGKVNESKPTNFLSSPLQPGLTVVKTSIENLASEQSSKYVISAPGPVEEMPSIMDSVAELTKDGTPANVQTVVTTSTVDSVAEESNKDVNFDQGPMLVSSESIAVEQYIKDANLIEAPMVGTTSSEKNPVEQSNKDSNLVLDLIFSTSSIENSAAEQSSKNVNLIQDNAVDNTLKEEPTVLVEKTAQGSTNPVVSDARVVIDVSSDSSSEEVTVISSPGSKGICSVDDSNDEASSKEIGVGNPSITDTEVAMPSFNVSSPFGLVGDAQIMHQITLSVSTATSPNFRHSLRDDSSKRKAEGMEKHKKLAMPLVRDESEVLCEQMRENIDVLLPTYVCDFVQDQNPPISASDKEDYDLEPIRGLPMSDSTPVFKDGSVNVNMSERMELFLPSSPLQKGTSIDLSRAQDAPTFIGTKQANSLLSDSKRFDNNENTNKQDEKHTSNNDSCLPVNVAMSERMEQLLSSSPLQNATSSDISRAQEASNFIGTNQANSQLSDSKRFDNNENTNKQDEKHTSNNVSSLGSGRLLASEAELGTKSDKTMQYYPLTSEKAYLLQSQELKKQINADTKLIGAATSKKPVLSDGVPKVFTNQSSSSGSLKETARLNHNARNKTWHRIDTPSSASPLHGKLQSTVYKQSAKKQSPKKHGRALNSSYVRKGNSLIRKPSSVAHHPILPYGIDAGSKISPVDRSMDVRNIDNTNTCSNPFLERPKTPPLPLGSKILSCTTITEKEIPQLMPEDPIPEQGVETQAKSAEGLLSVSGDNPNIASGTMSEPLTGKILIYVKHKSNQLVAAPQSGYGDSSAHPTENNEKLPSSTSSDFYYMRKKNQLVLNSLSSDTQHKKDGIVPIDNPNSSDRGASNVSSLESSRTSLLKRRLNKVARKTHKHSKFSRVWTLSGEESGKNDATSLNSWKVMPYLFPWKRTKYCKFSRSKTGLNSNRSSLSLISRKLQLARKRDTVYTVSTDGFSLRRAGVVSVGGSSLKWSKSIDRNSKKANEVATLAVAEVERKKREKKRRKSFGFREKNGHSFTHKSTLGIELQQGERVFRVGSVRYKMDASKRTLIRIPDGPSPDAVGQQLGKNIFVPRRLLIGNNEYIRIGNGSQLVRDPKKLIRILASEKIRWSLHTARLRLAKKQRYCQFFTRFGKCNKGSGKCPYIHDPEKVAICTKFVRGVCTDAACKLTHKIIPERMPDCSYFLQGLCTNISCPYRHVHVNPKASVCDGFLRGYCADGDECRKKHSYACPLFEATGECPQGSKCKLHHPKIRTKSKKRKRGKIQSNNKGRYFGSSVIKDGEETQVVASGRHTIVENGSDPFCLDGQYAEFISIDVGNDSDDGKMDVSKYHTLESDSDLSDMHPDELDALIKPVAIEYRCIRFDFNREGQRSVGSCRACGECCCSCSQNYC